MISAWISSSLSIRGTEYQTTGSRKNAASFSGRPSIDFRMTRFPILLTQSIVFTIPFCTLNLECGILFDVSTSGVTPIDLHITPIDGRNYHKIKALSEYFSEHALNRERIFVEVNYLIWLSKYKVIRKLSKKEIEILSSIPTDYHRICDIESRVNHDVKVSFYFELT